MGEDKSTGGSLPALGTGTGKQENKGRWQESRKDRQETLEKALMLGKAEGRRRRGPQRMRRLDGITDLMDRS